MVVPTIDNAPSRVQFSYAQWMRRYCLIGKCNRCNTPILDTAFDTRPNRSPGSQYAHNSQNKWLDLKDLEQVNRAQ